MRYLKIYESKQNWCEIDKKNTIKIINNALKQNPEINIDYVSDILLEMFDIARYYLKPSIRIYFKQKNTKKWALVVEDTEWDESEESYAKSNYYQTEKILNDNKYDVAILVISYDIFSLYKDNWEEWKKIEKDFLKSINTEEFKSIKKECQDRLLSIGYEMSDGSKFDGNDEHLKNCFYVYKEISYTHTIDTDYLDGIPENIIKDFHKFIISKKLNQKTTKELVDIFKKGLEK